MSYLWDDPGEAIAEAVAEFRAIMAEGGDVHRGLGYLNKQVSHRFTGIYLFDDPMLRNVMIFDRENPTLRMAQDAPLKETYCALVGATREPFATADSRTDERLTDHPARESVQSYSGCLLRSPEGEPLGTLCHFDTVPREIPGEAAEVMAQVVADIEAALAEMG